ncbi:MAG: PAS domain S-box protein [Methanoregula sp.]|nr:PAS domain S-box protein [Methanoregula sp.]
MIHVLYVDDETALLDLTKLFLERTGDFSVDTAVSAKVALGVLADHKYEVVVSDYQMPGMTGIDLLQQVRKSGNPIPFIIFTGRGREEVVIEAFNSGADSYIQKGGNPRAQFAELAHKIKQIVRRARAERALKEGAARYRAIFQNASDIILVLDREKRIVYESPSAAQILGYPLGSLKGKDTFDYIHPEDHEQIRNALSILHTEKKLTNPVDCRLRKSDGTYVWTESVATNLVDVESVGGIVITIRPIAERKAAEELLKEKHQELHAAFGQLTATEEELRQNYNELARSERRIAETESRIRASEAFLKCVIADVREGISVFGTDLKYTLWNPFLEELTGIPESEVIGKHLEEKFPIFKGTEYPTRLKDVLSGETIESPDIPIDLTLKKKKIWIRCIASPLYDYNGKIFGVIVLVQDITVRKEMELALREATNSLRENEEKYRGVFEAKNNPLLLVDAGTFAIRDMNGAALSLYGYSREEMMGRCLLDLSAEPEKTREILNRQIPRISLRYHRRKDGTTFPADITLAFFSLKGEAVLILSIRDLTGVQQIGDALRVANVKLNLLLGVTRHDVLNSLAVLLGYNEVLRDRENDSTAQEMLEKQEKAILAIRSQIEFTRAYDDLGVKAPTWQHVGNTAARAYSQFINTISFSCETGDLEIYADPMLEKVFYNLFDNAFRYGEGVTKVRLSLAMDKTDLLLTLEDDGMGIPDNEKERIFSRGFGKNTGLGLFLTREILAITRIGIKENGEYRKGARFILRVPQGTYRLLK